MYVKVKSMDGTEAVVFTISKLTSIDDFRGMVEERMNITKDRQRLFYRGKQVSYVLISTSTLHSPYAWETFRSLYVTQACCAFWLTT